MCNFPWPRYAECFQNSQQMPITVICTIFSPRQLYAVQSAQQIDTIMHVARPQRVARYTRLPLITRTPSFPLREIFCLGLNGAGSRASITTVFTLFRGSFGVIFLFFWWSEGRRDFPEQTLKYIPPRPINLFPNKCYCRGLHQIVASLSGLLCLILVITDSTGKMYLNLVLVGLYCMVAERIGFHTGR